MILDILNRAVGVPSRFIRNLPDEVLYRQWLLMGLASSCLSVAFILSLLATLSLPVVQSMYLIELTTHTTSVVRLGLWGYCQKQSRYVRRRVCGVSC